MKRIKILGLFLMLVLLTGCQSKYVGTWCRYSDVATTLVIFNDDVSDDVRTVLFQYFEA